MNLLTVEEASQQMRVSPRLLRKLWSEDRGPPRLRVGKRVLLDEGELHAWLRSRVERPRAVAAAASAAAA